VDQSTRVSVAAETLVRMVLIGGGYGTMQQNKCDRRAVEHWFHHNALKYQRTIFSTIA
jgi:hypothetical protein